MDPAPENRPPAVSGPSAHRPGDLQDAYNNPMDKFWAMYLADAYKNDAAMIDSLKGDADGILIFTGLFAATVSAFIIEGYKTLKPDSGDDTVSLLSQISNQIASISNGTRASAPSPSSFHVPAFAVRINALWFTSLYLSLSVALAATLMQQWSRRYLHAARRRGSPHKRGPVHVHLLSGLKRFRIVQAVEVVIALLHLSVVLFIAGLVDFLLVINPGVAHVLLPFVAIGAIVYLALSVLPLFFPTAPYDTPLTLLLRVLVISSTMILFTSLKMIEYVRTSAGRVIPWIISSEQNPRTFHTLSTQKFITSLRHTRKKALEDLSRTPSEQIFNYALHLTLKALDEEWEIEEFLTVLPAMLQSISAQDSVLALGVFRYVVETENIFNPMASILKTCLEVTGAPYSRDHPPFSTVVMLRHIQVVMNVFKETLKFFVSLRRSPGPMIDTTLIPEQTIHQIFRVMEPICGLCVRWDYADSDIAAHTICMRGKMRLDVLESVLLRARALNDDDILILRETSLDPQRPSGQRLDFTWEQRWTSTPNRAPRVRTYDITVKISIAAAVLLDNITCFLRSVWPVADRNLLTRESRDLILKTASGLSSSFGDSCMRESRILHEKRSDSRRDYTPGRLEETAGFQSVANDFASVWARILYIRQIPVRVGSNGGQLFNIMDQVARVVLPHARQVVPDPAPSIQLANMSGSNRSFSSEPANAPEPACDPTSEEAKVLNSNEGNAAPDPRDTDDIAAYEWGANEGRKSERVVDEPSPGAAGDQVVSLAQDPSLRDRPASQRKNIFSPTVNPVHERDEYADAQEQHVATCVQEELLAENTNDHLDVGACDDGPPKKTRTSTPSESAEEDRNRFIIHSKDDLTFREGDKPVEETVKVVVVPR